MYPAAMDTRVASREPVTNTMSPRRDPSAAARASSAPGGILPSLPDPRDASAMTPDVW